MRTRVNNKVHDILMTGILSVSGLKCNLLSVRKLEMNGFSIMFKDGKAIIAKENSVAAIAYRKDKLYELYVESLTEVVNVCRTADTAQLRHYRLGHLSSSGLRRLANMQME